MIINDDTLRKVHTVEIEILNLIESICKANGIKYSLAYGTMLGAVRHKGFIPWDDDLDIWMFRQDYDKFIKVWKSNPPEGYLLQATENDPEYRQNFIKIRKRNTAFVSESYEDKNFHHGIFVDIFPLDQVPDNGILYKKQLIYAYLYMLYHRGYTNNRDGKILNLGGTTLLHVIPKKFHQNVVNFFERKIKKYNSKVGRYNYSSYISFRVAPMIFKQEWMKELVNVQFENNSYTCFKHTDSILKTIYGDYMKYPPIKERTWRHKPVIIEFDKEYHPKNN